MTHGDPKRPKSLESFKFTIFVTHVGKVGTSIALKVVTNALTTTRRHTCHASQPNHSSHPSAQTPQQPSAPPTGMLPTTQPTAGGQGKPIASSASPLKLTRWQPRTTLADASTQSQPVVVVAFDSLTAGLAAPTPGAGASTTPPRCRPTQQPPYHRPRSRTRCHCKSQYSCG